MMDRLPVQVQVTNPQVTNAAEVHVVVLLWGEGSSPPRKGGRQRVGVGVAPLLEVHDQLALVESYLVECDAPDGFVPGVLSNDAWESVRVRHVEKPNKASGAILRALKRGFSAEPTEASVAPLVVLVFFAAGPPWCSPRPGAAGRTRNPEQRMNFVHSFSRTDDGNTRTRGGKDSTARTAAAAQQCDTLTVRLLDAENERKNRNTPRALELFVRFSVPQSADSRSI